MKLFKSLKKFAMLKSAWIFEFPMGETADRTEKLRLKVTLDETIRNDDF